MVLPQPYEMLEEARKMIQFIEEKMILNPNDTTLIDDLKQTNYLYHLGKMDIDQDVIGSY